MFTNYKLSDSVVSAGQVHQSTRTVCTFDVSLFFSKVSRGASGMLFNTSPSSKVDDESACDAPKPPGNRKIPAGLCLGPTSASTSTNDTAISARLGPRKRTASEMLLNISPSNKEQGCDAPKPLDNRKIPAGLCLGSSSSASTNDSVRQGPRKRPTGLGHGLPSSKRARTQEPQDLKLEAPPSPSPESTFGLLSSSASISSGLSIAAGNTPSPSSAPIRVFSSRGPHLHVSKFAKRTLCTVPEDDVVQFDDPQAGPGRVVKKMASSQIIGSLTHKSLF